MCGRYSMTTPDEAVRQMFDVDPVATLVPRYNLAPGQLAPVVRQHGRRRSLDMLRWGLRPAWSGSRPATRPLINARGETIAEKPAFRSAFANRRCLVPADGFYEWRRIGRSRDAYRICLAGGTPFAFAGLWETRRDDAALADTFAIVTTDAAPSIEHIHHRMPVILDHRACAVWLEGEPLTASALLRPPDDGRLEFHRVSPRVGDVRHDDPQLLDPYLDPEPMLF